MSQSDVYELLKNRRLSGDDGFYSLAQIRKMLADSGVSIEISSLTDNVRRLKRFGYLDWEVKNMKKGNCGHNFFVYRLRIQFI